MQSGNFYRFVKTEVESLSMLKGENSWFKVSDANDEPVCYCHVIGNCLGGTSTFHLTREDPEVLFRLEPRRKFLNLTYFVSEGADGPQLAKITLFASRGLKVDGPDGREAYRVIDPQGKLDKFMQDVLDGCCTAYAIVDDDELLAEFERRQRPEAPKPEHDGARRRGIVRRLLARAARGLLLDWCVDLREDGCKLTDHRPLLAAMILLQEQSIRLDQST